MTMPFDPSALGSMLSGFQQKMQEMKEEVMSKEFTGSAGGGLVEVVATGALSVNSVRIESGAYDDPELLEDLIVAATNDALGKAKTAMKEQMAALTGGLPLPPGLLNF